MKMENRDPRTARSPTRIDAKNHESDS